MRVDAKNQVSRHLRAFYSSRVKARYLAARVAEPKTRPRQIAPEQAVGLSAIRAGSGENG